MLTFLQQLNKAKILSFFGCLRMGVAYFIHRKNLLAVLRFTSKAYPQKKALIDDNSSIDYKELYVQSKQLAYHLQNKFAIQKESRVAFLCRNHSPYIKALVALSGIGANAQIIDLDLPAVSLLELLQKNRYDLIVYDIEYWDIIRQLSSDSPTILSRHLTFESIESLSLKSFIFSKKALKEHGTVSFLGSDNQAIEVPYSAFLNSFRSLLEAVELASFPHACIAVPMYHYQGISALVNMLVLGKKIVLTASFQSGVIKTVLLKQKVQIIFLHPFLLRQLAQKGNLELIYLKRIIATDLGVNPQLIADCMQYLGPKLYYLYGLAQAPNAIMATPDMLQKDPYSIGRATADYALRVENEAGKQLEDGKVGRLYLGCRNNWYRTDKIVKKLATGQLFWKGSAKQRINLLNVSIYLDAVQLSLLEIAAIYQVHFSLDPNKERVNWYIWCKKGAELTEEIVGSYLQSAGLSTDNYTIHFLSNPSFNWQGKQRASMQLKQQWELR